eukprot:COSAG01_NODE_2158_length_8251_cov_8.554645_2_plen_144_part_00
MVGRCPCQSVIWDKIITRDSPHTDRVKITPESRRECPNPRTPFCHYYYNLREDRGVGAGSVSAVQKPLGGAGAGRCASVALAVLRELMASRSNGLSLHVSRWCFDLMSARMSQLELRGVKAKVPAQPASLSHADAPPNGRKAL